MREIKFRAWSKPHGSFVNPVGYSKFNFRELTVNDNVYFMQYTGLKDKNGVEIYEGDILAFYEEEEFIICGAVKYGDVQSVFAGMYFLCDKDEYSTEFAFEYDGKPEYWNSLEIIGNIYENPELLE